MARARGWRYDWVLDLAIRHYFDSIDQALLRRAVRKHPDGKWAVLYIARWLNAPAQLEDGTLEPREQGTPHGSVVAPRLANRFWHSAVDRWMQRPYPHIPFERFADDAMGHGVSEAQAQA